MTTDKNDEEEPEGVEEKVEEVIPDHEPPESVLEMGYDEFQERISKMWESFFEPIKPPVEKPIKPAEEKPEEEKKEEPSQTKKVEKNVKSKKTQSKKKPDIRRIRLFR